MGHIKRQFCWCIIKTLESSASLEIVSDLLGVLVVMALDFLVKVQIALVDVVDVVVGFVCASAGKRLASELLGNDVLAQFVLLARVCLGCQSTSIWSGSTASGRLRESLDKAQVLLVGGLLVVAEAAVQSVLLLLLFRVVQLVLLQRVLEVALPL